MHPGQAGVVTGAEEVREWDVFRIEFGYNFAGQIRDPVSVDNSAHGTTIGNLVPPVHGRSDKPPAC